jgi:phosphatidylglycerol:prolipoprotein diacylglycerol transferase
MHPVLLRIPGLDVPIYSYGAMLGLALLVGWYLVMWLGTTKERFDRELIANCFLITIIVALASARIAYVLTSGEALPSVGSWFDLGSGGLLAYGGFIGGLAAAGLYLRVKRVPLMAFTDVAAPAVASGIVLGRIGCYLHGCDFGARLSADAPSWLSRLGTFPRWSFGDAGPFGSPAHSHHVAAYELDPASVHSFPVHPTQLYEAALGVGLLAVTFLVFRRRRFRGQVFLAAATIYGVVRFGIEELRDDPELGGAFGFTTSQLLSIAIVPSAIGAWVVLRKAAYERPRA